MEKRTAIHQCDTRDAEVFEAIWRIINDAAQAYKGVIPADRWHEPYMTKEELQHEINADVVFWGYEEEGTLNGVMGIQHVQDVTLIRHAYVRTEMQHRGIGGQLLVALKEQTTRPTLVGTWKDAAWAIRFYEKRGFRLVSPSQKDRLLRTYWSIPGRQVETSVVLADQVWFDAEESEDST
jgi:N-acetylglutamate synthase-like GNAT family acetyltransferase